ncbi:MAG TPA: hypothetical protein PLY93_11205 [Turneriella sp.]|nr:hypothetical protein [Turneriella sp.]
MLKTSISLPRKSIPTWLANRWAIMRMYTRFLRIVERKRKFRRGVTRQYNKGNGHCGIVKVSFTAKEYDSLHTMAAGIRTSVSYLIYYLIQFWEKASEKKAKFVVGGNYTPRVLEWSKVRVNFEEKLSFRRAAHRFFYHTCLF